MLALRPRAIAIPRARTSSRIVLAARLRYYSVVANAPIPNKTKVWSSADEAVKDVKSGDIILSGGASATIPSILLARVIRKTLMPTSLCHCQGSDFAASLRRSSLR